ncbi:MAG: tetratricopeptide repeat protein, partial [Rhodothermales bacterium]
MNRIHFIFGGVLLLLFAAIAGYRLLTGGNAHDAAISPQSSTHISAQRTEDDERSVRFWQLHRQAGAERIAGNYERAIRLYKAALELDPRHEDALYYLSNVYLELGRLADAERTLQRLTEAYPANARGRLR